MPADTRTQQWSGFSQRFPTNPGRQFMQITCPLSVLFPPEEQNLTIHQVSREYSAIQ
jgi:hypothetical protein